VSIISVENSDKNKLNKLDKSVSNLLALISTAPRKVVFMARTGVLIKQQANRFKKFLPGFRVS